MDTLRAPHEFDAWLLRYNTDAIPMACAGVRTGGFLVPDVWVRRGGPSPGSDSR